MLDVEGGRPICLTEQSFMNKNKKLRRKGKERKKKKRVLSCQVVCIVSSETLLEVFQQLLHVLLP